MMLGARTGAWAKVGGGVPTARDYVQDGLIAMWDGIENAGWGVHDPSANVWNDLVGTNDAGVSIYGAFEDNSLNCLGTSYAAILSGPVENLVSLEIVCSETSNRGLLIKANDSSWVYDQYSQGVFGCSYNSPCYVTVVDDSLFLTLIYDQSTRSVLSAFGRSQQLTVVTSSRPPRPSGLYSIGGRSNTSGGFNGEGRICKIHSIRCYNHALTADEIAANYAIDKARFNI